MIEIKSKLQHNLLVEHDSKAKCIFNDMDIILLSKNYLNKGKKMFKVLYYCIFNTNYILFPPYSETKKPKSYFF